MKKPILSGLCLALSYLSFSQSFDYSASSGTTLLYRSLEQYSLFEHNISSQLSFLSQWSSIGDHPYNANLGISYIPDLNRTSKPEASLSINTNIYGPFKKLGSTFSLGIIKSLVSNKIGYRGGIQLAYEQTILDPNKLIWAEPELENINYSGSKNIGLGFYLGGWYSIGVEKKRNIFSFSFESADLLTKNESGIKSLVHPYTGRYTLSYNLLMDNSRLVSLYQLDLSTNNKPVHSISVQYYFPFKLYGGVILSSTKTAGLISGFYWKIDNDWDTTFDINYQYLQSYEEYGISAGDTHQLMIRCSGKF